MIDKAGVETVYFKYDDEGKVIGNWNKNSESCPTLNGINYGTSEDNKSEFYGAYKVFLSEGHADYPWSTYADTIDDACVWDVTDTHMWMSLERDYEAAVVLSKTF